jgi:hypothetical protein
MGDEIKQSNVFGDNLLNSSKRIIKIVFTRHRVQGFIAGLLTGILGSLIASFIYHYLTR